TNFSCQALWIKTQYIFDSLCVFNETNDRHHFHETSSLITSKFPSTSTTPRSAKIMAEASISKQSQSIATSTQPLDLDMIPGQIGNAVLRSDGTIIRLTGNLSERDVGIVYRMLLEIGTVLEGAGLQRVTVGFRSVSYAVALGGADGCLYVVKKKSSS
ncbi:hypothetical protein ACHAXS_008398, partial [Conticribra weissflogii]